MTTIQVRKPEAAQLLDEQMAAGRELLHTAPDMRDRPEFDNWRRDQKRWLDITTDVLRHIYGDDTELLLLAPPELVPLVPPKLLIVVPPAPLL